MFEIVELLMFLCFFNAPSFSLKTSELFETNYKSSNQNRLYSKKLIQSQDSYIKKSILSLLIASALPIIPLNIPQISAATYPIYGADSIMNQKTHGTSEFKVQDKLRFGVDVGLADKISNYNRHWAEFAG